MEPHSVIAVYDRQGAAWSRLRSDELIETAWLDRFCASLAPGATVLDIGCGSGVLIGAELIRRGYDLTGVDGSTTMLALFRQNLPSVSACLMDMRQLALRRRFSAIIAWDSFFHLAPAEQRRRFARYAAHAEPGAPLMFTSGHEEGAVVGELEGDALYHGSLDPDEYRTLLDASGFGVIAPSIGDRTCRHRTVWLARHRGRSAG